MVVGESNVVDGPDGRNWPRKIVGPSGAASCSFPPAGGSGLRYHLYPSFPYMKEPLKPNGVN